MTSLVLVDWVDVFNYPSMRSVQANSINGSAVRRHFLSGEKIAFAQGVKRLITEDWLMANNYLSADADKKNCFCVAISGFRDCRKWKNRSTHCSTWQI
jgi:hypothetical protein